MRHLLTLADVSAAEIQRIFSITEDLKSKFAHGLREALLPGRVLALLFEKQSLRTRVSFEAGITHLGGTSLMLGDDVCRSCNAKKKKKKKKVKELPRSLF